MPSKSLFYPSYKGLKLDCVFYTPYRTIFPVLKVRYANGYANLLKEFAQ